MSYQEKLALEEYKKAINKIDDFFEYANESKKDREFIHGVLDNLTIKLAGIYNGSDLEDELAKLFQKEIAKEIDENGSYTWKEWCAKDKEKK
jgi:hypothetical protein